jgi:bidirectional [NiFe] hydrogenase diaphorase subunit
MDHADLLALAEKERRSQVPCRIRCCLAGGCLSANSQSVKEELTKAVAAAGLEDRVQVVGVGCMRLCSQGPLVQIDPGEALYQKLAPVDAPSIVASLNGGQATAQRGDPRHPFFAKQMPVALENCGIVDPERIESYIAANGYQTLHHVLNEMQPADVVEAITTSGLRGRGGAGYPTGLKWALVAKMPGPQKYVICNADEGDPGAFKDRTILSSDPHRVLEAMAIAGYAVGADHGFIYIRGEYPLAIHRLQIALRQARRLGLLGSQIFDSAFNFRIDLRIGAGAFVCGEETALMASIEGRRGTPRPRPPYPGESGLWYSPTLINNVETFSNVTPILRRGPDWYASIGVGKSRGTKVFSLAGKVRNTGLVEVPMGMTLRTIVEEMGGGAPDGSDIKAVQTGGPSGGCIPERLLDTPVDYEAMAQLGSIVGSGGMIVMDRTTDMVDVARFFMEFCMEESCGKCIPCRAGTVQMHGLLAKIHRGEGSAADLARLEALADMVKHTSLCGLGQSAPNPVQSTLRYFREEYKALIKN